MYEEENQTGDGCEKKGAGLGLGPQSQSQSRVAGLLAPCYRAFSWSLVWRCGLNFFSSISPLPKPPKTPVLGFSRHLRWLVPSFCPKSACVTPNLKSEATCYVATKTRYNGSASCCAAASSAGSVIPIVSRGRPRSYIYV